MDTGTFCCTALALSASAPPGRTRTDTCMGRVNACTKGEKSNPGRRTTRPVPPAGLSFKFCILASFYKNDQASLIL